MNVHEKFYGHAMQEITSGAPKRHDLWAKAVALSIGDQEAAHAIYLELVARHLSEASLKAERQEMKDTAVFMARQAGEQGKIIGFKALCWAVWGALSFMIYLGGTNWAYKMYDSFIYDFANTFVPRQDSPPSTFQDLHGNKLTEPTMKEYYQAVVEKSTGIAMPGLSELAKTSAHENPYFLGVHYGDEGGHLLSSGYRDAELMYEGIKRALTYNPQYMLAVRTNFFPWSMLAVICLGAWYMMTRMMLKTYRRGYFYKPAS